MARGFCASASGLGPVLRGFKPSSGFVRRPSAAGRGGAGFVSTFGTADHAPLVTGTAGVPLAAAAGEGAACGGGAADAALKGGGVDARGGSKSVSSLSQVGQTFVPRGQKLSHIPQTTPISRSSFCNVSSRS